MWLKGPAFLLEGQKDASLPSSIPVLHMDSCDENRFLEIDDKTLKLSQTSCDFYMLKKNCSFVRICGFLKGKN